MQFEMLEFSQKTADLWQHWHCTYLDSSEEAHMEDEKVKLKDKWHCTPKGIRNFPKTFWPMARIIETHPGSDGLVRVANILSEGLRLKISVHQLVPLIRVDNNPASLAQECVQACLRPGKKCCQPHLLTIYKTTCYSCIYTSLIHGTERAH